MFRAKLADSLFVCKKRGYFTNIGLPKHIYRFDKPTATLHTILLKRVPHYEEKKTQNPLTATKVPLDNTTT